MIIDAHMHVDDIPALGWKMGADLVVSRLDQAGIDVGWVMTIVDAPEVNTNAIEWLAEAMAEFPGRLEGFARIHPWYGDLSLELLDRAFALGYKGLKFHAVTTIAHPSGEDSLRLFQVQQLLGWIDSRADIDGRIVCGDFNAALDKPSAALMATRFKPSQIAPTAPTPLADGDGNVTHPGRPRMSQCIDYIWMSGAVSAVKSAVCFNRPSPADATLWPSDHAGVWADIDMP